MKTLDRVTNKLDLAEQRYHEAQDNAENNPSCDNDEWLLWSKMNYEMELRKAAKREAAILKDLNAADQNQGRMPENTMWSDKLAVISFTLLGLIAFILWLLR